jgi:uncharacterized membrane protein YbhN (UPF0104 family)
MDLPVTYPQGLVRRRYLVPAVVATALSLVLWTDQEAGERLSAALGRVPWLGVSAVALTLALTWAHFALAAVAVRAASGLPLPLGEATSSQLASSAFNRILPSGIGGAAVNARYLTRRGLPLGSALAAIGTLGVLGAAADLAATALIVAVGRFVGLGGGTNELRLLATNGLRLSGGARIAGPAIAALVVATAGTTAFRQIRRRRHATGPATGDWWRHLAALARRPRRTSALMLSSAGTTVVLAVAFAVVVRAVAGATTLPVAALLVAYLVGAAAASAAHVPAIAGGTELALTAALVASGLAAGPALAAVLVFRGLTFWAPLPAGLVAARGLRRRGAL